jgi:tetratricopeptide (TPR) repeat protein
MSLIAWKRGLLAGCLIALVWAWTSTRVAAFQLGTEAEADFWRGRLGDALEKYLLLEHFGPTARKARAGLVEVYLELMESGQQGRPMQPLSQQKVGMGLQRVIRDQLREEPLRSETWSQLADVYRALKPGNQTLRTYSLEELSRPVETNLEIEDLLQIRALETSVDVDLNNVYHRGTLGDLEWGLGLREFAKQQYGEVVTLLPDPTEHLFLASDKVSDELEEVVIKALYRAAGPPRNAQREPVYRHLGIFLMNQGRFQEAYDAFQLAQDVSGRSHASWKAQAVSAQGRLDDAIALYREAMVEEELDGDSRFHILASLAGALEDRGRHREAAEVLRSALVLRPHDSGTLLLLGRLYESMGLWQDAEDSYIRASEVGTERLSNLAQLVLFYRRIGKPSLALAPARELQQQQPGEPLYRQQVQELEAEINSEGR